MSNFKIGLTVGGMVDIMTLSADAEAPFAQYRSWNKIVDLGNAMELGLGRPWAIWTWTIIPPNLHNALRDTYVPAPAKSAFVYIQTINNLTKNTVATYQAVMMWPEHDNLYVYGSYTIAYNTSRMRQGAFEIEFRDLVAQ